MVEHKIYSMAFSKVLTAYIAKAQRKERNESEVLQVIEWLTGYSVEQLQTTEVVDQTIKSFFHNAPQMNENRKLITGSICGVKLAEIQDPLMLEIRYLDKLIDELAKGKPLEKIFRQPK